MQPRERFVACCWSRDRYERVMGAAWKAGVGGASRQNIGVREGGCHARLTRRASLLRLRRPCRNCRSTRSSSLYWRGHPLGLPAGCCRRYSLHGCLARVVVRHRLHPPSDKRKRVRVGRTYRIRPRLSDACVAEQIEKITIHVCNGSGG